MVFPMDLVAGAEKVCEQVAFRMPHNILAGFLAADYADASALASKDIPDSLDHYSAYRGLRGGHRVPLGSDQNCQSIPGDEGNLLRRAHERCIGSSPS